MVATTEVLDTLKSIGLNLYERKIFVALLAKGVATAAQVSEIAGVPRSRSYDVLESLAEKGFVVVQPSKPIKYVVLKPAEALERTKASLARKHNEMVERITKIQASPILGELEKLYTSGLNLVSPSEMTGTLKGRFVINRQLKSIFKNAKNQIRIITTEHGLNDLYSNHFRILKKMAKNGIKVKILAHSKNQNLLDSFSRIGEIKSIDNKHGRFAIIDNDNLFMSLTDDETVHETQEVAFWVNSEHAVQSIAEPLFNKVWGA